VRAPRILAGRAGRAGRAAPPAGDSDIEIRKIILENDRKDQEAARAHRREIEKINLNYENSVRSSETASTREFEAAQHQAVLAAEEELSKLYHEKMAEVAIASIDRSRDSAKFVQTAATAILGIYIGLLALTYSVTDNPLPLRGAWAGVFLGLSIAFATAYLAFLTDVKPPKLKLDQRSLVQRQYSRTAYLTKWIKASVRARRYAIRAAVVSLLFGVLFIAAPFVSTIAPVPDIPEPQAPVPPSQVAPGFEKDAIALFSQQVADYEAAAAARAAALDAAKTAAEDREKAEDELNTQMSGFAGIALLLIVLGPWCIEALQSSASPAESDD
jgi:hypothetical protein